MPRLHQLLSTIKGWNAATLLVVLVGPKRIYKKFTFVCRQNRQNPAAIRENLRQGFVHFEPSYVRERNCLEGVV